MRNVDPEQRDEVNELLEIPLGMHPERTAAAKRRRAEQMRQLMGGS